jgi:hypothetical protein
MLKKTNFDEFCEKLVKLKIGESFNFCTDADEDENGEILEQSESGWFGVTRLHLFDCDRIIIASYGGFPEFITSVSTDAFDPYKYL